MKKVMLILMLVVCLAGCFAADKPETKTEIVAGQVWKWEFNGAKREILEVGEKYVVFCYSEGSYKSPDVETHSEFLEDHELVEDVKPITVFLDAEDDGLIWITEADPPEPTKPYLHKNPNNDHWICSKHGDLQENWRSSVMTVTPDDDDDGVTYCQTCVYRLLVERLNQHITGVKE